MVHNVQKLDTLGREKVFLGLSKVESFMTIIIKQTFDIKITHGNIPNGDILTTFDFDYKLQTRELHLVNFIRSNSECDQIQPIFSVFLTIGNDAGEWGG